MNGSLVIGHLTLFFLSGSHGLTGTCLFSLQLTLVLFTGVTRAHHTHTGHCDKSPFVQYKKSRTMSTPTKIPCAYVPHGGGPLPILGDKDHVDMVNWLRKFVNTYLVGDKTPSSILVVSAHWEEKLPTVQSGDTTKLYYDYYGFPKESYNLDYKLIGATTLAKRVGGLLEASNIPFKVDSVRGYDHGVFIPMMLLYPEGNIPTVQISLVSGLDPETHIKLGEALTPLREEGVFILGSGMSYHNMRGFNNPRSNQDSEPFHDFLRNSLTATSSYSERKAALAKWTKGAKARECHPREEHLIPLHVILGATKKDENSTIKEEFFANVAGVKCAGYVFQ